MISTPPFKQGKSNNIVFIDHNGRRLVQKIFEEKLTMYDVFWPITRKSVEQFTYNKLSELCSGNTAFHQPELFDQLSSSKVITIEYIAAPSLMQIFSKEEYASLQPDTNQLSALIKLIHSVNQLPSKNFSDEEKALLKKQSEIASCMYHNKANDEISVLVDEPWHFCLGDVSLNNILFDGNAFTLIDFECAHMGYSGYDLGQLLGMTAYYADNLTAAQKFYQGLISALKMTLSSDELREVDIWATRFTNYYSHTSTPD